MMRPDGSQTDPSLEYGSFSRIKGNSMSTVGIQICKIDKCLFVDDPQNKSGGRRVEYNVTICQGPLSGRSLYNVRDTTQYGGVHSSSEIIREEATDIDRDSPPDERAPEKTNGELVLVANVSGNTNDHVIIGTTKHPLSDIAPATSSDGVRSISRLNGVETSITKDGDFVVQNIGDPTGAGFGSLVPSVDDITAKATAIASAQTQVDTIITNYTADVAPDIDITDELSTLTSFRNDLGGASDMNLDDLTSMSEGLESFAGATPSVSQLRDLTGGLGGVSGALGFSQPIKLSLTKTGTASMGNDLQKMSVDKMGQAATTAIGGMGQRFAVGGVSTTTAPFTNIISSGMTNIKSALTNIGTGGLPSAKLGDVSMGVDSMGAPVISKLISGSYISMVGA